MKQATIRAIDNDDGQWVIIEQAMKYSFGEVNFIRAAISQLANRLLRACPLSRI